jgi:uncharacterized protein (UPF0333 family)
LKGRGVLNLSFLIVSPVIAVILSKVTAYPFSTMNHKTTEVVSSQFMLTAAGEMASRADAEPVRRGSVWSDEWPRSETPHLAGFY